MKVTKLWQSLLLAVVWIPATMFAQPFNNLYVFQSTYYNSVHTDGVQLTNGLIAEGGTIDHPFMGTPAVVEIGLVVPGGGLMIPSPFFYTDPDGSDMRAVDLVESLIMPGWVVQVANYTDPATGLSRIRAFKTDPATGALAWVLQFGNTINFDLIADAITVDANGDYFVLGHISIAGGIMIPYLIKFNDAGVFIWEFMYNHPDPNASHESVDLLYDPATNNIILAANRYLPIGTRDGFVAIEIDATTGAVITSSHVPVLAGISDIEVRDMDLMFTGEYAIVGRVYNNPDFGFLVKYTPGLAPAAPFSMIYIEPSNAGIYMTGVKPFAPTAGMFMSYEWGNNFGLNLPGMAEMTPAGFPVAGQSLVYNVPGIYTGSRGLIALNGFIDYVIKGEAVDVAGFQDLSLIADVTPLAANPGPPQCSEKIDLKYKKTEDPIDMTFKERRMKTYKYFELKVEKVKGDEFDCDYGYLGSFRLARPTGIEGSEVADRISIYPNPSNGMFTLELSNELVDLYEMVEIYNSIGELVYTDNLNKAVQTIDLSSQMPGIYLLRMTSGNGDRSEAQRIMIR